MKKEYEKHSSFYRHLLNGSTLIMMKLLRIRVHVNGLEQIPHDTKRLLFVSNHRSNYDPIITWHVLKQWNPAFVSKAENFKIPIFGYFVRRCCFMSIDRENPRNALKTITKAADLLDREEVSVGIYPEGTRSRSGTLLPFHNGVFKIAQIAHADIVVLTIREAEMIHKNIPWHHTDVYLNVLEVLPSETVVTSKTKDLGQHITDLMKDNLGK